MIELKHIISSELVRKKFESFLNNHPTSYHPLDIERLDHFICSAQTYCRNSIDLNNLRDYLSKHEKWCSSDIEWCITRIKAGFDIIRTYKSKKWV